MKIHEFQAKDLLAAAGAAIPRGIVVTSPPEAQKAFDQIGKPVVLKAQIHAGGRGKGRFKDSGKDFGGVKYLTNREDVAAVAEVMFKFCLVTKQTGPEGQKVSKVLVQEAADIAREIYVGLVVDRSARAPVLMACAEGGVEIEEVAARSPEKILKVAVSREWVYQPFIGFPGSCGWASRSSGEVLAPRPGLVMIALVGIPPTGTQQPRISQTRGHARRKSLISTPNDVRRQRLFLRTWKSLLGRRKILRQLTLSRARRLYINLNGNIGCLVNGAGLAMGTMDIIKLTMAASRPTSSTSAAASPPRAPSRPFASSCRMPR